MKFEDLVKSLDAAGSPSARKVWIEIYLIVGCVIFGGVTFRKEGVD